MIKVINSDNELYPIIVQVNGTRQHFTKKAAKELLDKLSKAITNKAISEAVNEGVDKVNEQLKESK